MEAKPRKVDALEAAKVDVFSEMEAEKEDDFDLDKVPVAKSFEKTVKAASKLVDVFTKVQTPVHVDVETRGDPKKYRVKKESYFSLSGYRALLREGDEVSDALYGPGSIARMIESKVELEPTAPKK